MSNAQEEKKVLADVDALRRRTDAIIILGILPGDRIFYSVDDRVTIPDLDGILKRDIDFTCSSVAKFRATRQEMKRH